MKKILAVLLSLLMLMMSMAVYATEAEHVHEEGCACEAVETVTEVQPRANICSCGTIMTRTGSTETRYGSPNCTHGAAGNDYYKYTDYYYEDHCTNCGNHISTLYKTTPTLLYCPKTGG